MSATHYSEDDLTLYYYGEARRRDAIERHLEGCSACASVYRDISGTLAMIAPPEAPERGDQYGLEVWQRIRHQLPERRSRGGHLLPPRSARVRGGAAMLVFAASRRAGLARPRPACPAGRVRWRPVARSIAPETPAADPRPRRRSLDLPTGLTEYEALRTQRHLEAQHGPTTLTTSPLNRQYAWSRRAIGGGDARRPRAQPARNRQQPLEDQRRRPRADSAADRRGGAVVQSAGNGRRAPAARRRAGSVDPANFNTENRLTIMMNRIALTLVLLAGPVAGAAAAGPWSEMRIAADSDDRADDLYDEGRVPSRKHVRPRLERSTGDRVKATAPTPRVMEAYSSRARTALEAMTRSPTAEAFDDRRGAVTRRRSGRARRPRVNGLAAAQETTT